MSQTTYVDETTGEHLATVRHSAAGHRVTISPRLQALLTQCSCEDNVPEAISGNVFYAHHYPDARRAFRDFPLAFASDAQCRAALQSLLRLQAEAAAFLNRQQ